MQWTAHTTTPQPAPAPAPRVMLDVEIQGQSVWNKKQLVIDTERIVFGNDTMLVREIETVAY